MLKYKKILFFLLIYFIYSLLLLHGIPNGTIQINTLYTDVYVFIIILLIYNNLIVSHKMQILQLYRFKKLKCYICIQLKKFTIKNFIMTSSILILNILSCYISGAITINIIQGIHYALHLFLIYEIFYLISFLVLMTKHGSMKYFGCLFIFLFMFFIGSLFPVSAMISLNLFYSYFKINHIVTICINYLFWILMVVLIYWNIKDRLEL